MATMDGGNDEGDTMARPRWGEAMMRCICGEVDIRTGSSSGSGGAGDGDEGTSTCSPRREDTGSSVSGTQGRRSASRMGRLKGLYASAARPI